MRVVVKVFLFFLFALAVFGIEYWLVQQHVPQEQVRVALDQFGGDHKAAADQRTWLWFLALDSVTLAVAVFVFFVGVVVFWDELVAAVKWLVLPKHKEPENGKVG